MVVGGEWVGGCRRCDAPLTVPVSLSVRRSPFLLWCCRFLSFADAVTAGDCCSFRRDTWRKTLLPVLNRGLAVASLPFTFSPLIFVPLFFLFLLLFFFFYFLLSPRALE
ncbi:hypothetical protein PINS_up009898 [Pythium insidiosum]|nr:hypothetical protein PINS_up009898 [Pythium insidiosum]